LNASQHFSRLFTAYAKAINNAYGRTGSIFQHPFGRIPIVTEAHLIYLVAYIHQNPQKHGLVRDFRDWPYSSYATFMSRKPTQLKRDAILDWFGGVGALRDFHQGRIGVTAIAPLMLDDFD